MTITFVTNLVHHHQLPVADEFYKMPGVEYHYIACEPMPDWLIKGGYDPTLERPYIIRTYEGEKQLELAKKLIDESDVVIIGSAPNDWVYNRKKENKVTFHYHERWLKHFSIKLLWPNAIYYRLKHFTQFRNKRTYMLCASAFTSKDVKWYGAFPHKCFKWGYFTKVDEQFEVEAPKLGASTSESTPLMWCARFLRLKHPELPVQLAAMLKKEGYKFHLDMFGSGEELERIKALITELGVDDCVSLCGNRPNEEILQEMRKHSIFLFTSDRNEGWGAVLNEAMSNGCAVVASDEIGSAPYLIEDGKNGLLFKSNNVDSLYLQAKRLLDDDHYRRFLSNNAVKTMQEEWSPKSAAMRFVHLYKMLLKGLDTDYVKGPCSKA